MRTRLVLVSAVLAAAAGGLPALAGAGHAAGVPGVSVSAPVTCTGDPGTVNRLDVTVDGTATYWLYAVPSGAPKGLVVFDHGYQNSAYAWVGHLSQTARDDGVIAVAPDYRGTVDNPTGTGAKTPWNVLAGAQDTVAAAQLFDQACQVRTVVAYGVSMGGNTSGLAVEMAATRLGGHRPLFDYWFDIEGATNEMETYLEASALAPANGYAAGAKHDIETEMGGPLQSSPQPYVAQDVVLNADRLAGSGLRGVVIVHAADDGLVPHDQSREMQAQLRRLGIPVDFFTVVLRSAAECGQAETTATGYATDPVNAAVPGSPNLEIFAGHSWEGSSTALVITTGLDRLAALFASHPAAPGGREVAVSGTGC